MLGKRSILWAPGPKVFGGRFIAESVFVKKGLIGQFKEDVLRVEEVGSPCRAREGAGSLAGTIFSEVGEGSDATRRGQHSPTTYFKDFLGGVGEIRGSLGHGGGAGGRETIFSASAQQRGPRGHFEIDCELNPGDPLILVEGGALFGELNLLQVPSQRGNPSFGVSPSMLAVPKGLRKVPKGDFIGGDFIA